MYSNIGYTGNVKYLLISLFFVTPDFFHLLYNFVDFMTKDIVIQRIALLKRWQSINM